MEINWTQAGATVLSGMTIVFVALIILIFLVQLSGKVTASIAASNEAKKAAIMPAVVSKATDVNVAPIAPIAPISPVLVVEDGIEDEIVAAISATISVMMQQSAPQVQYALSGIQESTNAVQQTKAAIQPLKATRPSWGFAGMQQNTRPF